MRRVHQWNGFDFHAIALHRGRRSGAGDFRPVFDQRQLRDHLLGDRLLRELHEELGLAAELEELTKLPPGPLTAWEHSMLYRCSTDAEPRPDPSEIAEVLCLPLEEWQQRIDQTPLDFAPVFLELWNWYRQNA